MSELQFHVEWASPEGARGPELRATWARLEIEVGGESVTRVEDQFTGSVRNALYGPIYPLAEWIATNWWPLLYEIESRSRAGDGYLKRHTLTSAAEGFALPALRLQPEGRRVELVWEPLEFPLARVRFLASGSRSIERAEIADSLRAFIRSVVGRLHDQGCSNTFLEEEWNAVEAADPEEMAFCRAAGSLGCDPYALTDHRRRTIIRTAEMLPPNIHDEAFASMDPAKLPAQGEAVSEFIEETRTSDLKLDALKALREQLKAPDPGFLPWEQGYQCARRLRAAISNHRRVRSSDELANILGVAPASWHKAIETDIQKLGFLEALVATTAAGAPRFALQAKHERSRTFTICRALFEYLYDKQATAGIVASTRSERQKRNRAFAAEFLAPASEIKSKIGRVGTIATEQIEELSEEFGTSEWVIRHQIDNHGLATFAEWQY